jgi:hypothetical protein
MKTSTRPKLPIPILMLLLVEWPVGVLEALLLGHWQKYLPTWALILIGIHLCGIVVSAVHYLMDRSPEERLSSANVTHEARLTGSGRSMKGRGLEVVWIIRTRGGSAVALHALVSRQFVSSNPEYIFQFVRCLQVVSRHCA